MEFSDKVNDLMTIMYDTMDLYALEDQESLLLPSHVCTKLPLITQYATSMKCCLSFLAVAEILHSLSNHLA